MSGYLPPLPVTRLPETYGEMRSDYDAMNHSRFRRRRMGLVPMGGGADWHYRNESKYLELMESARDMVRNDAVVGPMVDQVCRNTVQGGFQVDPQTGDEVLDTELKERWSDWANDPDACDVEGERTFSGMERLVLRHTLVDGDIIVLPTDDGRLQMVEAHRLRTPKTKKNVVHGVMLDPHRKRVEYWLTADDIDPNGARPLVRDMQRIATRDGNGHRQVYHIYNDKRVTQTRGVTAFAPVFSELSMIGDINFAKLVQQQVVSCFALIEERIGDYSAKGGGNAAVTGEKKTLPLRDGSLSNVQGIGPGMRVTPPPGVKYNAFSPGVPNAEYFPHVKLILTLVGINLGLPLVLVLMDASETNFSGWRGAIDQARMGFKENQKNLIDRFHKNVWAWRIRDWMATDQSLRRAGARADINLFSHRWQVPLWNSIQPKDDAEADSKRLKNLLSSWRRVLAERGLDVDDIRREIIEDKSKLISAAIDAAQIINVDNPEAAVDWRELVGMDPKGRLPEPKGKVMDDLARGVRSGVPIAVSEARATGLGLPPEPPEGEALLRFNDQDVLQYHVESGILTINETRDRLNLPSVPWGDVPVRKAGVELVTMDKGGSETESDVIESDANESENNKE